MSWDPEREAYWRQADWSLSDRELERRGVGSRKTAAKWRKRVGHHSALTQAATCVPTEGTGVPTAESQSSEPYQPPDQVKERHQTVTTEPADDSPEGWEGIRKRATKEERHAIDSLIRHGSVLDAAVALDITPERLRGLLQEAKRRSAAAGWRPDYDLDKPVPPPFTVKGVSTYYGADGEKRGQWVKTKRDQEHRLELLLDAVQHAMDSRRGLHEPVAAPKDSAADLLSVYPIGDLHLGMFAWGVEAGEDFDLDLGERTLCNAVDQAVAIAPPSEQALIINLGDFFHTDTKANRTTRAGNVLDVDTRWAKVFRCGAAAMIRCVDRALEKHNTVRVICEIGNHDDHSAITLATCLSLYYQRDERVEIDTSPAPFHWHRFGANLIGVTHGSGAKPGQLPGIMATDRAKDWGDTRHRYWYTGHVHHHKAQDFPGCVVESFRALAPADAWAHSMGYRASRDMRCDVLHRERGRINRHIIGVDRLGEAS